MLVAPTASIHQCPLITTITLPSTAATPKHRNAARFTASGRASPEAVNRTGPTRTSSVPRMPSE